MFTGAIVLATGSLQYLNHKINKINFVFGLFLNILTDWYLLSNLIFVILKQNVTSNLL